MQHYVRLPCVNHGVLLSNTIPCSFHMHKCRIWLVWLLIISIGLFRTYIKTSFISFYSIFFFFMYTIFVFFFINLQSIYTRWSGFVWPLGLDCKQHNVMWYSFYLHIYIQSIFFFAARSPDCTLIRLEFFFILLPFFCCYCGN